MIIVLDILNQAINELGGDSDLSVWINPATNLCAGLDFQYTTTYPSKPWTPRLGILMTHKNHPED